MLFLCLCVYFRSEKRHTKGFSMRYRNKIISFIILALSGGLFSQTLPNIESYKTLKCDLHMHTIFSDGLAWPSIRVEEAIDEGLDAIAISDHLEYLPHKKLVSTDRNIPTEIAKKHAKGKDLVVIAGAEITRWMPPGHFNVLFIKDANKLVKNDFLSVVEEAVSQDAFIFWNHPGWVVHQPDRVVRWYDIHQTLVNRGWLHGIEFSNYHEYYPAVAGLAKKHHLTFLANSDIHSLTQKVFLKDHAHRPLTLVFAKTKSEQDIREALFAHRCIALSDDDFLAGPEDLLKNFITACLTYKIEESKILLINKAELPFKIKDTNNNIYSVPPLGNITLPHSGTWTILNTYIDKNEHLSLKIGV